MASSEEKREDTASPAKEETQENADGALEQESGQKEKQVVATKERQFDILMQQVQSEASINRVTNLHPNTRHKMKNQLERSTSEKLADSAKRKISPEDIQRVYQEKAEKAKAEKLDRLRASFSGSSSNNTSPKADPEDE